MAVLLSFRRGFCWMLRIWGKFLWVCMCVCVVGVYVCVSYASWCLNRLDVALDLEILATEEFTGKRILFSPSSLSLSLHLHCTHFSSTLLSLFHSTQEPTFWRKSKELQMPLVWTTR